MGRRAAVVVARGQYELTLARTSGSRRLGPSASLSTDTLNVGTFDGSVLSGSCRRGRQRLSCRPAGR